MQAQAERSIASHSGTECGIGRGEFKVKLAATIELYAYWNRLRGARSAPERNDVDPGAIRGVLADTFVLDFDASCGFPFRIAGSRANALFLKELRGFSFLDLWRGACRLLAPRYAQALQTSVCLSWRPTRDLTFGHAQRVRAP